jgi:hypothetical protein
MQTHHLNIVERRPLYGGDVLGGNWGKIWSDLEAGKVRSKGEGLLVWFEVEKREKKEKGKRKKKIMWRERERERENHRGETENQRGGWRYSGERTDLFNKQSNGK